MNDSDTHDLLDCPMGARGCERCVSRLVGSGPQSPGDPFVLTQLLFNHRERIKHQQCSNRESLLSLGHAILMLAHQLETAAATGCTRCRETRDQLVALSVAGAGENATFGNYAAPKQYRLCDSCLSLSVAAIEGRPVMSHGSGPVIHWYRVEGDKRLHSPLGCSVGANAVVLLEPFPGDTRAEKCADCLGRLELIR